MALDLQYYLLEIRPQTQGSHLARSLSHPVYSRLVYSCWLTPAWVNYSLEVLNLQYDLLRTSRPQTHGSRWSIANFTPARMSAMLFTRRCLLGRFAAAAWLTPTILFTRRCLLGRFMTPGSLPPEIAAMLFTRRCLLGRFTALALWTPTSLAPARMSRYSTGVPAQSLDRLHTTGAFFLPALQLFGPPVSRFSPPTFQPTFLTRHFFPPSPLFRSSWALTAPTCSLEHILSLSFASPALHFFAHSLVYLASRLRARVQLFAMPPPRSAAKPLKKKRSANQLSIQNYLGGNKRAKLDITQPDVGDDDDSTYPDNADGGPSAQSQEQEPNLTAKPLANLREIIQHLLEASRKDGLQDFVDAGQHYIRVGTLCSGTDAPLHVMNLFGMLKNNEGERVFTAINVFGCEIEPFKQGFLMRNSKPQFLFRDARDFAGDGAQKA